MWCKHLVHVIVCFNYNNINNNLKSNKCTAKFLKCPSYFTNRLFSDVPEQKNNFCRESHVKQLNITLRTLARKSSNIDFFIKLLLQLGYELLLSEMQKNWGVTDFVSEIRYLKGHPNFEKSAFLTRYGSNVFMSKNIANEALQKNFLCQFL